jgi:hypothetical protein
MSSYVEYLQALSRPQGTRIFCLERPIKLKNGVTNLILHIYEWISIPGWKDKASVDPRLISS